MCESRFRKPALWRKRWGREGLLNSSMGSRRKGTALLLLLLLLLLWHCRASFFFCPEEKTRLIAKLPQKLAEGTMQRESIV